MQINKDEEISKFLLAKYPDLVEDSVWSSTNADYALFIPVKADRKTKFKSELLGVKQLEYVKPVLQRVSKRKYSSDKYGIRRKYIVKTLLCKAKKLQMMETEI
jgi:hypothetical protein